MYIWKYSLIARVLNHYAWSLYTGMITDTAKTDALHALIADKAPPWRPITSRTLAPLLGVSLQSLANWRVRGSGPPFEGLEKGKGNKIFYRPDRTMAWLSNGQREPWEYCRDWLVAHRLDVVGGLNQESTEWMVGQVDELIK